MLHIGIYHPEKQARHHITQSIAEALKELKILGQVFSIRDPGSFAEGCAQGRYQFEIMLVSTEDSSAPKLLQRRKKAQTEFILLDTPPENLGQYLKYKPIACIYTSAITARCMVTVLQNCLAYIEQKEEECFCIQTKFQYVRIPYSQILYFESSQHHILVHTVQQKNHCAFAATLNKLEEVLPENLFLRCHQSYLVNRNAIRQTDRTTRSLGLSDGTVLNISKRHYSQIEELFVKECVI